MLEMQTQLTTAISTAVFDPVSEGERLFTEGRLDEAKAMFNSAVDACPGNALAWNNLAVIALTEGEDKKAESFLRQALEIQNDFLDARFNLVEIYGGREQWGKAERELKKILEIRPSDLPATKCLVQVYLNMGEPEKAKAVLDESRGMGAMKSFIDSLWLAIKYYGMADDLTPRDKMEKFVGAFLKYLDGDGGRGPRYKLVAADQETGEEVALEGFYDSFYYKESPSMTLDREDPAEAPLVLTIGDNGDWDFFREALRAEMKAEGGCLGDFTQARKVLRREQRLARYDLGATLKYFQNNVGPCDCHVLRAVLV